MVYKLLLHYNAAFINNLRHNKIYINMFQAMVSWVCEQNTNLNTRFYYRCALEVCQQQNFDIQLEKCTLPLPVLKVEGDSWTTQRPRISSETRLRQPASSHSRVSSRMLSSRTIQEHLLEQTLPLSQYALHCEIQRFHCYCKSTVLALGLLGVKCFKTISSAFFILMRTWEPNMRTLNLSDPEIFDNFDRALGLRSQK